MSITTRRSYRVGRSLSELGRRGLLLLALCFLAIGAQAQTNRLSNPGFETGDASGWANSYGNYHIVTGNAHSGTYAAQIGYGSGIRRTVAGLTPNTVYTLSGWVKVTTAGQHAYLGADTFGGTSVSVSTTSAAYVKLSLTFTTGASNTSASVWVYESGADPCYADDLALTGGTGDANGTQAFRIADCLQRLGVNTFSRLNYNGYPWSWGGSKGSYDAATTARAINYITAGSGLTINDREYHHDYGGDGTKPITPSQLTWIHQVYAATGSPFTIAIGSNGSANDIPGIVSIVQDSISSGLNYVKWVEGLNEPNNNFGSGTIPIATTASVQSSLYAQIHAITSDVEVAGPSIVFGLPDPENWLTAYMGTYQSTILANSDLNNLHVYPPKSPNGNDASTAGTLDDVDHGFSVALPGRGALNTEWHPTLYCTTHKSDRAYDAYWGPIYLLSSFVDYDWDACFWFALFDYSATMKCGLFATDDTTPYAAANAFRALFALTGDTGAAKLTFPTEKLDVTVSGLPAAPATGSAHAGGRWALFENSAHQYFLLLWNEQGDLSTATTPVTVTFNSHTMAKVEEFNITSGSQTALQSPTNVNAVTVNLDTSLRLLRITY
ncbi:MAG TPA: carbohydrate binding domain-containing protein [Candidatus Methylacidiphilales bacterium]